MSLDFVEAVKTDKIDLKPNPELYKSVSRLVDLTLGYLNRLEHSKFQKETNYNFPK